METDWKPGSFADDDGQFRRPEAKIRNFVSADPDSDFPAEANRYVLYVHYACPWAHRIVIVRVLKGLEDIIDVVELDKADEIGWAFSGTTGPDKDPRYGFTHLRDLYLKAFPDWDGRSSVPVLWDTKKGWRRPPPCVLVLTMLTVRCRDYSQQQRQRDP